MVYLAKMIAVWGGKLHDFLTRIKWASRFDYNLARHQSHSQYIRFQEGLQTAIAPIFARVTTGDVIADPGQGRIFGSGYPGTGGSGGETPTPTMGGGKVVK
jgi:hypothetical protein